MLKPVPDDLGWLWGVLIAAGIFLLVALFVYFIAQRTLWDLSSLLVVPFALVVIGLWFTAQQDTRQSEIEEQRAQDAALQAYLDQMSQLLLEQDLRNSAQDSEVRTLARARTLTVLGRLDPSRKTAVMQFLVETELVQRVQGVEGRGGPIITLAGANLSGANLSGANLSEAELGGADLRYADLRASELSYAYLRYADLREAYLSDADLSFANLSNASGATEEQLEDQALTLEGATMPDGQKYEETGSRARAAGKMAGTAALRNWLITNFAEKRLAEVT